MEPSLDVGSSACDLGRDWNPSPPKTPGTHREVTLSPLLWCSVSTQPQATGPRHQLNPLPPSAVELTIQCFVYWGYVSQWWRASNQHCRKRMCVSEAVRKDERSGSYFNRLEPGYFGSGLIKSFWNVLKKKKVLCNNLRLWTGKEMWTSSIKQIFYKCLCWPGELFWRHFCIRHVMGDLYGWLLSSGKATLVGNLAESQVRQLFRSQVTGW